MAAWASGIIYSEHLWCNTDNTACLLAKKKKRRRYSMTFHSLFFLSALFSNTVRTLTFFTYQLQILTTSSTSYIPTYKKKKIWRRRRRRKKSSDSWSSCLKNKVWHSKRPTEHQLGSCSIIRASSNTDLSQKMYTSHFLCLKTPNSSLPGQRLAACSRVQTWAKRQKVRLRSKRIWYR